MSLCGMAQRIAWLRKKADHDPLRYFCATPPQQAYLKDESPIKALIGLSSLRYACCGGVGEKYLRGS